MNAAGHPKAAIADRILFEGGNKGNKQSAQQVVDGVLLKEQQRKQRDNLKANIKAHSK
jgi:hypothetical protein